MNGQYIKLEFRLFPQEQADLYIGTNMQIRAENLENSKLRLYKENFRLKTSWKFYAFRDKKEDPQLHSSCNADIVVVTIPKGIPFEVETEGDYLKKENRSETILVFQNIPWIDGDNSQSIDIIFP